MKLHSKSKWTPAQKILRYKKWNEMKKFKKRKGQGIFGPWLKHSLKKSLLIYSCIISVLKETVPQNSSQ